MGLDVLNAAAVIVFDNHLTRKIKIEHLGERKYAAYMKTSRPKPVTATLSTVNQHNAVVNNQTDILERPLGLEKTPTGRHQVVNDQHGFTRTESPFDPRTVIHVLWWNAIDQWDITG